MSLAKDAVNRSEQVAAMPALSHKVAAPKAHRNTVERARLLGRIFDQQRSRVIVFQGPAGHGKTSLMLQAQQGCQARGMLTGWISLDETDNDVTRFLGQVQAMVVGLRAAARLGDVRSEQPRNADISSRTNWLVGELLGLGRPVAVFLDDLHFVGNRMMLGFLRELLASAPPSVRWFLASRVVPEIGLPRLVVGDEALVIRAEDLRFSEPEVRIFFHHASDVEVSDAEVRAIHEGTEGWPAAVQLYRLALSSPAVRQSLSMGRVHHLRELADYLADNVLARQQPRVQEFLLKTSVLARMWAPLCNTLLERADSDEILALLERTGLFVRRVESDQRMYVNESVSMACLVCGLIMALYEADEHDLAMTQFRQFREIIINVGIHDYLVIAYRAIARIHRSAGRDRRSPRDSR